MTYSEIVRSWVPIEFKSGPSYVKDTIVKYFAAVQSPKD